MIAQVGTDGASTCMPYLDDSNASAVMPGKFWELSIPSNIQGSMEFVGQKKVKEFWKSPKGYNGQTRR